jgi:hypothetical protein
MNMLHVAAEKCVPLPIFEKLVEKGVDVCAFFEENG